jgi:hypothetical protein
MFGVSGRAERAVLHLVDGVKGVERSVIVGDGDDGGWSARTCRSLGCPGSAAVGWTVFPQLEVLSIQRAGGRSSTVEVKTPRRVAPSGFDCATRLTLWGIRASESWGPGDARGNRSVDMDDTVAVFVLWGERCGPALVSVQRVPADRP